MWLMHSVLGQTFASEYIFALQGDRIEYGSLFDVAWQMTLDGIYKKSSVPSWYDAMTPLDYVNDWDEKFKHHCPRGSVLQGFRSYHDNIREDRRWKVRCAHVWR
mmetsp:Transcript_5488/g.8346  ORF Transcript_5488/g.8346 Transcript_5488/m.8346 type:complete len:104 (-) Transcript_5488:1009-1320(-)